MRHMSTKELNAIVGVIRSLIERDKASRRRLAPQEDRLMERKIQRLEEKVSELEKAVQLLTEIVETVVKSETKAASRRRWLIWFR